MHDNEVTKDNREIMSRDEWQEKVGFFCATGYYLKVFKGRGQFEYINFRTYPEAMIAALRIERAMLYVQTENHAFMVPEAEFPKYLQLYNQATGQKLGMPMWYKPKVKYGKRNKPTS